MKTSELTGVALDWAVAKCEGGTGFWYDSIATYWITIDGKDRALSKGWAQSYQPSTNWAQGGPIIEREELSVVREYYNSENWTAYMPSHVRDDSAAFGYGPTPLIAAMRCYVASKLGDEVEIPQALT